MNDTPTKEPRSDQTGAPSAPIPCPICGGSVSKMDTKTPKAQDAPAAHEAQDAIIVNTDVPAELNPTSPDFDVKKYREMLSSLDLDGLEHRLKKAVQIASDAAEAATAEITQSGIIPQALGETVFESLQEIIEMAKWAKETAQDMLTPELRRLFDLRDTLESFNWRTFIASVQAGEERIKALEPFLAAELPAIRTQPGYEAATLEDIESYIGLDGQTIAETSGGQPIPPFIRDAIERAAAAAYTADYPATRARRADIVAYPLDKVNSTVWNMLQETTGRQTKLALKAEKDGSEKQLNIYYSIDFEELETAGLKITKRLTPFDKRVYIAIAALYNAGNKVITLTQIHYAMGNTGRPAAAHLQKINDSVTKMRSANVFIDTLEESQVYNYPRFKYEDYLLPVARTTAIVNGKIADAAIHIKGEPPIMTFARQRKQITTITVKVLQSPLSKTDANLLIDDYLIERIGRAKHTGKGLKILYSTLYEKAQITTKNQRARAPEKIETYLKHYKACGLISRYSLLKDGIQIEF